MIKVARLILTILFKLSYQVEITGKENIPVKGAALLCANHNGILDMLFIGYKMKRTVHYMAKEELFRIPVLGRVIQQLGAFPVKRQVADIRAVRTALGLLKKGHIVGIFPEGTRTKGKAAGSISVKPGSALLAIKSGVPIIPVAVSGQYKLFSRIKVVFGQPFLLDLDKNKKYTVMEMTHISQNIMKKVYSLMEAT